MTKSLSVEYYKKYVIHLLVPSLLLLQHVLYYCFWGYKIMNIESIEKFENGAIIEPEEMEDIEAITGLGLITVSFGQDKNGSIVNTAKLTPFGLRLLKKHKAMRNPIKRFIYCFIDSFYH